MTQLSGQPGLPVCPGLARPHLRSRPGVAPGGHIEVAREHADGPGEDGRISFWVIAERQVEHPVGDDDRDVDAASFAIAAALVAALPGRFRPRGTGAGAQRAGLFADVSEGPRWLWRQPLLRALCVLGGISQLIAMGLIAVLVLYARHVLGLGPAGYGLLIAAFAVGGLAGAWIAPGLAARAGVTAASRRRRGPAGHRGPGRLPAAPSPPGWQSGTARSARLALFGSAAAAVCAGVTSSPLVAAGAVAGYGVASLVWSITAVSLRQAAVPAALLGRVTMACQIVSYGAAPLGAAGAGLLAHTCGLRAPFLAGAAVLAAAGLASGRPLRGAPR